MLFPPFSPSPPARVSLDDAVANDGFEGEPVTLLNVEDAFVDALGGSADVVRGSDAANALTTGAGNDVVDGLAGNDTISLGDGADLLEARDGYSDRISCGPGGDSVAVDQLDEVSDCESVTTTFVAPVGIVAPADIVPPPPPPSAAPPPPPVAPAADTSAPRCRIAAPATVRTLRGGVRVTATCDEAAALELTLSARVTRVRARAAAVGDLELTTRSLPLRAGARTIRLTVSAKLRPAVGTRATLRVGLRARDSAGNRRTTFKTIRLRARR
jgi:Ca2+-binding RTX toxin-like protein